MGVCVGFSGVLNYINTLYIYYWLFEVFERTLHIGGLFLLYKYVYDYHTIQNTDNKINLNDYFVTTTQQLRDISVE